jgi:hypothetical protein
MSEDDFFATPPAEVDNDAPIVLGPPSTVDDDPFAAPSADYGDYSSPPADYGGFEAAAETTANEYVGEINEAPSTDDMAAVVASGEPSPMQKWNAEWQATLQVRKDEENACKAAMIEQARVELEAFQIEREKRREAAAVKNRQDEQEKLEAIEADLENDNSWQRITKLVDLQHDSSTQVKDVKRMRDILIHMKNDTAKAQTMSA